MPLITLLLWLPSDALAQDPNKLPRKDIIIDGDKAFVHQLKIEYIPYLKKVRKLEIYNFHDDKRPTFPEDPNKLPDLSELINLSELTIGYTQVRDITSLAKLTQLRCLTLSGNPVGDLSPISQLTNLKNLHLDHMEITELSFLSKMTGLEHLSITDWDDHKISLTPLSNLKSLKSLEIREKKISDIPSLANLENLEKIDVYLSNINDISFLAGMRNLKQLYLNKNRISDISTLATLPNLSMLSLSGNQVRDLSPLAKLDNLETLLVYGNPLNKDAHEIYLPQIIKKNPNIGIGCDLKTGHIIYDFKLPVMIVLYISFVVCASIRLWKKKHKKFIFMVIAVVILTLIPLPVRDKDIEKVIKHSVNSLINDQRIVMLNKGYIPFYDSRLVNRYRKLCYINDINVDDSIYKKLGLEPYDKDKDNFAFGRSFEKSAVIEFTYQDSMESMKTKCIHFNYYNALLAAQGHRVIIYRNIFGAFAFYIFEWVS